jgi:hypothetical protein
MRKLSLYLALISSFAACTKAIEPNLPPDENRIVVESYLQPGQRFAVALQRSTGIVSNTPIVGLTNALVVIQYGNVRDTLKPGLYLDADRRVYNFSSNTIVSADTNTIYQLYVRDSAGNVATASTKVLPIVPIDSVNYQANNRDSISVGLKFRDPAYAENYYRRYVFKGITDTIGFNSFRINDLLFNGQEFSLFTGFRYKRGDTVFLRLYNLTKDHHDFLKSIGEAAGAANNPLLAPVLAKGNINGGLGIFTGVRYDEKRYIIPR